MYYRIGTFKHNGLQILKDTFYPKEGDIIELAYGNGRRIGVFATVKADHDITGLYSCAGCALMARGWSCKYRRIGSNGYVPICLTSDTGMGQVRFESIDNILEDI